MQERGKNEGREGASFSSGGARGTAGSEQAWQKTRSADDCYNSGGHGRKDRGKGGGLATTTHTYYYAAYDYSTYIVCGLGVKRLTVESETEYFLPFSYCAPSTSNFAHIPFHGGFGVSALHFASLSLIKSSLAFLFPSAVGPVER